MDSANFSPQDYLQVGSRRIELVVGNIVEQSVDAIVNAANTKLAGGGGVDGAVHRAAGPQLKEECQQIPADEKGQRCPTGSVRRTGAGKLKARYVIHAVGPFYNERYRDKALNQLAQVHQEALREAALLSCDSIAFPAISTGAYRFPLTDAAQVALTCAYQHLQANDYPELIRFVLYKPSHLEVFRAELLRLKQAEVRP